MYLVSQHSTEAPLDRQHTLFNRWRSTQFIIVKFQILCVSTADTALHFDIFCYYNDLKVFSNFLAFPCLCHSYNINRNSSRELYLSIIQHTVYYYYISCLIELIILPILPTYFVSTKHFYCQC